MDAQTTSKWARRYAWIIIAPLLLSAGVALAEEEESSKKVVYTFDLAGGDREVTVAPDTEIEIVLKNALPFDVYKYRTKTKTLYPAPLPSFVSKLDKELIAGDPESCDGKAQAILDKLEAELDTSPSESEVYIALRRANIDANRLYLDSPECVDAIKERLEQGLALYRGSTEVRFNDLPKLRKGQAVIVMVRRDVSRNDAPAESWEFTLSTGEPPRFEILYGFSFVTNGFNKGSEYHTRSIDSSSYKIVRNDIRGWDNLDYSPTIFAALYPFGRSAKVELGIMAGIGAAKDEPNVALGPFVTFWRNIGIGCGVAVHRVDELRSQYKADTDRLISESLDFDQLHDKRLAVDAFFSLMFRFGSSPFSSGNKEK